MKGRVDQHSASRPILAALRRPRDEAQLTQILAGFASSDAHFASGLAQSFINAAPHDDVMARLGPVPSELSCVAEHQAIDETGGDRGFVDLRFFNESEGFELLVELKLHSSYGTDQLERYRASLDPLARRSALLAVTTWLPDYGEDSLAGDPQWLGSARWSHAFDAMRGLEHRDPSARALWRETLDLVRDQGDFGVMDIDEDAVHGWARWKEGRRQLTAILTEIHEPTLAALRKKVGQASVPPLPEDAFAAIQHKNKRLVWPWGESLHIQYAADSDERERFRTQFLGGHDELYFTAEARHGDDRIMKRAAEKLRLPTQELRSKGFDIGHNWGSYWARVHASSEWMDSDRPTDALMALVEKDIDDLLVSGIFGVLNELPESGPPASPIDPADFEAE